MFFPKKTRTPAKLNVYQNIHFLIWKKKNKQKKNKNQKAKETKEENISGKSIKNQICGRPLLENEDDNKK